MMYTPTLDPRLKTVFDLFPSCRLAADIGADHGKLALALVTENRAQRVAVTDISRESLKKAEALFARYGVSSRADFLAGDGLTVLKETPGALSICGMGGRTVSQILENGLDRVRGAEMILSPQTEIPLVRRTLYRLEYRLTGERCVLSSGRYYIVLKAAPGGGELSEKEYELGPFLIPQAALSGTVREYYSRQVRLLSAARDRDALILREWYLEALSEGKCEDGPAGGSRRF